MSEFNVGDRVRIANSPLESEEIDGEAIDWNGQLGTVTKIVENELLKMFGFDYVISADILVEIRGVDGDTEIPVSEEEIERV